jgi:hypothetical protein
LATAAYYYRRSSNPGKLNPTRIVSRIRSFQTGLLEDNNNHSEWLRANRHSTNLLEASSLLLLLSTRSTASPSPVAFQQKIPLASTSSHLTVSRTDIQLWVLVTLLAAQVGILCGTSQMNSSLTETQGSFSRDRDGLYEPILADSEREAVADLLQYLENVCLRCRRCDMNSVTDMDVAGRNGLLFRRTSSSSQHTCFLR